MTIPRLSKLSLVVWLAAMAMTGCDLADLDGTGSARSTSMTIDLRSKASIEADMRCKSIADSVTVAVQDFSKTVVGDPLQGPVPVTSIKVEQGEVTFAASVWSWSGDSISVPVPTKLFERDTTIDISKETFFEEIRLQRIRDVPVLEFCTGNKVLWFDITNQGDGTLGWSLDPMYSPKVCYEGDGDDETKVSCVTFSSSEGKLPRGPSERVQVNVLAPPNPAPTYIFWVVSDQGRLDFEIAPTSSKGTVAYSIQATN